MPFQASVVANVRQSTASAGISNLNNSIFISEHAFFKDRIKGYSSMSEVNSDSAIPKDSNAYKALQQAFSAGTVAVPIYLGRREVDEVLLTPDAKDNTTYKFTLQVMDTEDGSLSEEFTVQSISATDESASDIASAIVTASSIIQASDALVSVDGNAVSIVASANRQLIVTGVEELSQTFVSTESATTCYAEITEENKEDYYFVTSESRDETFVKELAQAVETSTGSYPKQYCVASQSILSISPVTSIYVTGDILQMIQENEFTRTFGIWDNNADEIFPELATCVKAGGYTVAGKVNWKFLQNTAPVARHPVKGRILNTAEQGYIKDRNASWVGNELSLSFLHGGTTANGNYVDLQIITDWTKITMEARVLTALVNANNGGVPLTMRSSDLSIIKERCESVLSDGVNNKLFSGFTPIVMPTNISFEDQAGRLLKDVNFVAYFASKINFVIIDGNLTYNEEIQ